MRLCGECGLFCSFGAMWPAGICTPRADRFVHPTDEGCVMWQEDWRGADQSDGVDENWKGERHEGITSVHSEGPLGPVDPVGNQDVRKPQFSRSIGILPGSRIKQPELF